jgi:hypothetical protein
MKVKVAIFLFHGFWSWLSFSCVLIWCVFDYSSRFLDTNENVNKNMIKFEAVAMPELKLKQKQEENLLSLYKNYLVESNDLENSQVSLTDQLKQQGLLSSLHINDKELTLKAVLKNEKANARQGQDIVALILVVDRVTKEQSVESFKDNSDVFGYKLAIEKGSEVTLSKVHDSGVQSITLTMYKTDVKNND